MSLHVYPATKRSWDNNDGMSTHNSRILTEQNIVNIRNSITDTHSYVVNYDSSNMVLEFVIEGYYIKVSGTEDFPKDQTKNLFAFVEINNNTNIGSEFVWRSNNPVIFSNEYIQPEPESGGIMYSLQILENGSVINKGKFNFSSFDIKVGKITCGKLLRE